MHFTKEIVLSNHLGEDLEWYQEKPSFAMGIGTGHIIFIFNRSWRTLWVCLPVSSTAEGKRSKNKQAALALTSGILETLQVFVLGISIGLNMQGFKLQYYVPATLDVHDTKRVQVLNGVLFRVLTSLRAFR